MTECWIVEVDLGGINYKPLCWCFSEPQAQKQANYFRPMAGFSGKDIRVRKAGEPAKNPFEQYESGAE